MASSELKKEKHRAFFSARAARSPAARRAVCSLAGVIGNQGRALVGAFAERVTGRLVVGARRCS